MREQQPGRTAGAVSTIPFREHVLENGLRVVVHEDRSDPVVAVYVAYHVGSARETPGRSGLAHLFEHLMFEGSANVPAGEHFRLIQSAGGSLNGTTSFDRTWYYEVLPAQHLELALWLEADRMGGLLPALSQAKLDIQRDVVKNERRQSYENRPYGRVRETVNAALYPAGHPYSWVPIGSMADIEAADLGDLQAFFRRWYGPNNAVLVIAGDVDAGRALELARRHFEALPRGPEVGRQAELPVRLDADRRAVLEDRVQLPQATLAWPTATAFTRDDAALALAAMVLSQNKSALLDRALTVDRLLARSVGAGSECGEVAGQFLVSVTAAPGVELAQLEDVVRERIASLARDGVEPEHLARMQARAEADHVWHLETVGGKAASLSEFAVLHGDPGFGARALEELLALGPDDVRDVVRRYLADRPAVVLSAVPEGKPGLAAPPRAALRSEPAPRPLTQPPPGPRPELRLPALWHADFGGLAASGTRAGDLPVTALSIALPGGRLYETRETTGLAALTAALLQEGTRASSTTEFVDRLDRLGANVGARAGGDELVVSLSVLDKHLAAALALLEELLFEPRLDPADFERLRKQALIAIDTRGDQIRTVAANAWASLVFGDDTALGRPAVGTRPALERLALDDVRAFHARALARPGARLVLAGGHAPERVRELLAPIAARLAAARDPRAERAPLPILKSRAARADGFGAAAPALYLIDKPGAPQSELRVGHLAVAAKDPDFFPLAVLNYVLGGAFTSRLNQNLREKRGFTYGAHSSFEGDLWPGPFTVATAVHAQSTAAAVAEIQAELEAIRAGVTDEELAHAKQALSQSLLRQFEPIGARLQLVDNSSRFGWPADYPTRRLEELERLTRDDLRALAARNVRPERLAVLVVGDRERIAADLAALGAFEELDVDGKPLVGAR